jgi:hypothetical protein
MHHDHELEGKGVRATAFKAGQGGAADLETGELTQRRKSWES